MIRKIAKHTSSNGIVFSVILPLFSLPSSAYLLAKNLGCQFFISANSFLKPIRQQLVLMLHYKVRNLALPFAF
ncbi:hypothetical protein GCM10007414_34730 [Agarivorans gilvus]|uniref:Uncharacterized protein n=1 Tax=Agarivorans gilvus TaxID=680279 RepID=A0ABQ1I5C2_9ALTE|nr:hypothetical protein GCM10007414_34730 [Agarivorans gilvus]